MQDVKKMTIGDLYQGIEVQFMGISGILAYRRKRGANTLAPRHIVRQVRDRLEQIDRLVLELDARAAHGVVAWGDTK